MASKRSWWVTARCDTRRSWETRWRAPRTTRIPLNDVSRTQPKRLGSTSRRPGRRCEADCFSPPKQTTPRLTSGASLILRIRGSCISWSRDLRSTQTAHHGITPARLSSAMVSRVLLCTNVC